MKTKVEQAAQAGLVGGNADDADYVLIVDDDDDYRAEMAEYLSARGIAVVAMPNAEAAVEHLRQREPRLVIVDLNMPGMDGLQAVSAFRRLRYDRPIILMSGDADAIYRANVSRLGVFAVLSKPIPLRALERHIRSVMESNQPGI